MHKGHRDRLRKKFLINDLDSLEDHEILELALFYAIPRKNTNEIAHELLKSFGSVSAVFDAPLSRLKEIKGIGESAAIFIKLVSSLTRVYMERKYGNEVTEIPTNEEIKEMLVKNFIGRNEEAVAIVMMDAKGKILYNGVVNKGSVNGVDLYVRKIIELVIFYNACSFIIAHNHPSGIAVPSKEDIISTKKMNEIFKNMNVKMIDHIVVADGDYVSIMETCSSFFD